MSATQRRAVIVHGKPDRDEYMDAEMPAQSNSHWIPWLQNQLLIRGYNAQTPEMLESWNPQYKLWESEFERHLVAEPMTLVGHSCGGGFLLRWLSENPEVQVDCLALVAPWLDPSRKATTDFFEFEIDPDLARRIRRFHVFHSNDDMESIIESVQIITSKLDGFIFHEYDNMGHFCLKDLGTVEFPDLLNAIVEN